ncbi:MAG TPA: type III pantothenate kinase [Opitutaceae bacterium]|nr:type III pantothenate kinase [Opitutaceae bacterium]
MKTLVLNLGNTSLFGGVFSEGKLRKTFRVPIATAVTTRGFARLVEGHVRGPVDRVALCSVVPAFTPKIAGLVRRHFGVVPQVLTVDAPHGLKIGYRQPRELGTDRLAAAIGARKLFPGKSIIVIDCGTATTVTALHRDGTLLGGAIFPGLGLWPAMLASRTAQLPEVKLARPRRSLGRSTRENLQSGFFHGQAGAIREVVRKIQAGAFGRGKSIVVATGGHAARFAGEKLFDRHEPGLVLIGLDDFSTRAAAQGL